ncbi:MAG: hypothetical protein ACWGQW_05125 [bacterium]
MFKRSVIVFGVLLIVCSLFTGLAAAAPAQKVDVCHLDEYGVYHRINVSENALPAHFEHGDSRPGDPYQGMFGYVFGPECEPQFAFVAVDGDWRGESGIAGTMGYWFNMTLSQDSNGNVTGSINYDIGVNRTVTGYVSGFEFTFTTHDNPVDSSQPYWADCTPCTVNAAGTYFHGYGTSSSSQNIEFEASR